MCNRCNTAARLAHNDRGEPETSMNAREFAAGD
jgi:hypothetical protein